MNSKKTLFALLAVVMLLMIARKMEATNSFNEGDMCFLVDPMTVILFSESRSEILCLRWENGFSSTVLYKYKGAFPLFVDDLRIVKLPNQGVFLTWVEDYASNKGRTRISAISWDREHQPEYVVIKEDDNIAPASPLRVLRLGDGKYRFFYCDSSELHTIGLMHLENFYKIKTFLFSNGIMSDEKILNKKGRFSVEDFDVRQNADNTFQMAWSQDNMKNGRHEIFLASYAADGAMMGKQKKVHCFDDDDEIIKNEDVLSIMYVKFINNGFFIGRDINRDFDPPEGDVKKGLDDIFEVNLFDSNGLKKQSYRIDYASRVGSTFCGYWEKEGLCYFVGYSGTPGKREYSFKFNAISDKKVVSKVVTTKATKNEARDTLRIVSEPDGFFYWLEVDENGKIQLRSQPVQEK
ncbi:MAG TPA: hypothetical protein PK747_06045 [Acidobacteriota bacterium]|nr:hypothetical protein [Acidobacteriota bacterium]HNT17211.1 hypothetical protein [Acidobacteriota bacterium]HQO19909.1 hypothetical protein [Acidobacteriota bacterium]HQQ46956.1 hypothetical protein [Acidobacteriota bacterium]